MNTLTFFLHGTGYHEKGKIKTVISALSEVCLDGYTLSGPGGKSAKKGKPRIPGTYEVDPQTGKKTAKTTVVPTKITELVAKATGWGVDQNLIEMLIQVERQQPPPDRINLVGFSRGADACLRFANVMYEFYPHIEINILAIEPVPGPGRHGAEQARTIPPNVKHYVSTLALHENVALFRPQDYSSLKPADLEQTKVECLPFPGHHGVHSRFSEGRSGTEKSSELVQDLARTQLEEWGTTFSESVDPQYPIKTKKGEVAYKPQIDTSPVAVITKYSVMMAEMKNYGKLSTVRSVARYREDYSPVMPDCFINQHHLKLFAKTFPVTYQYMLDPEDDRKKENSSTELEEHPEVKAWLEKTFEAPLEANPEKKQRNFFNVNKDRLDGNYLRVAMAVHDFRTNPINSSSDKKLAQQLMQDCQEILRRSFGDKEAEIEKKVEAFCKNNPKCRLNKGLEQRLRAKEPSLSEKIVHDLKAMRNQNLLQKLVEQIEGVLSPSKEQYYSHVRQALTATINYVLDPPEKKKDDMVKFLKGAKHNIEALKQSSGVTKKSTSEIALEKLIARTQSDVTLAEKSTAIHAVPASTPSATIPGSKR